MKLTVGHKVYYPSQGPCRIGSIVNRVVDGKVIAFYHLIVLLDGGELYVPIEKAQTIGVRLLMERSEIPRLLDKLKQTYKAAKTWKERIDQNSRLLASGSPFDLAVIVESLAELRETKALAPRETQTLEKARKLLICEISEVTGETVEAAEEKVDLALKARKVAEP